MVDAFMPDVVVEIAFDSGYTTPAASRTWTDVSTYVELADGIEIDFGRQDERSSADANSLSLTLDNSDGRFTAGRAASPYYPNVKIGRPIRVTVTPPGGTASTRFVGFVDEWPVEWDGTDAYARASITASSRLARLGLGAKFRSMPEQQILDAEPFAYWTLGDASGSTTAAESSGVGLIGPLVPGVVGDWATLPVAPTFGDAVGSPVDGLTAMTFPTNGHPLDAALPNATVRSWRFTFLGASGAGDFVGWLDGPTDRVMIYTGTTLEEFGGAGLGGTAAQDALHDVVLTSSAADGAKLYIDGVLVDTAAGVDHVNMTRLRVGYMNTTRPFYVFCHVALYDVVLTADQVARQAAAVLHGFEGDRTDTRLVRLLEWAGVPSTEVAVETGGATMTYQQTSGQSVMDAAREVESTEAGVLFDDRDGNVTFHNRSHRYGLEPAVVLDATAQHVGRDYRPKLDRSTLANDVTAENPTTERTARLVDTASRNEYGFATQAVVVISQNDDVELPQRCAWITAAYAEPSPRVPSLTVDVLAHQGLTPSAQDILALTMGDRIQVANQPTQADSTTVDYFVEGYSEHIGAESYGLTFNLSPVFPAGSVLILDHATRAGLDEGNVAGL